jgi:hypothetical protein
VNKSVNLLVTRTSSSIITYTSIGIRRVLVDYVKSLKKIEIVRFRKISATNVRLRQISKVLLRKIAQVSVRFRKIATNFVILQEKPTAVSDTFFRLMINLMIKEKY